MKNVWIFLADGRGAAYQRIEAHNKVTMKSHVFTYTTDGHRVIIQDEIDKEWEGHFGVTRWNLINKQLVGDVKFLQDTFIFSPMPL